MGSFQLAFEETNMQYQIFVPHALNLHRYALSHVLDKQWTDSVLRERIQTHITCENSGLLHNTLPNGFLYILGSGLFTDYFVKDPEAIFGEPIDQWGFLEVLCNLLGGPGCEQSTELFDLIMLIDEINDIWDGQAKSNFNRLFRRRGLDLKVQRMHDTVTWRHMKDLSELSRLYAINFAERVFHDREYCEYLSYLIANMFGFLGVPTANSGGVAKIEMVSRKDWPSWLYETLRARDRGKCAQCGNSFDELDGELNVDHIIPLAEGGCNDLVNLQLLCAKCNKSKGRQKIRVTSSIPPYLTWGKTSRIWRRSET